jgi:hypothetical protein
MTTRSQGNQIKEEESVASMKTSIPCFCGNQHLLKYHAWNCKQQMLNWISTGDPYTWAEKDYAHESEVTEPMHLIEEEEEDLGLPHLFNETGYRGLSDIDPNKPPVQEEEEEEEAEDDLPDLDEIENCFLDETPPGPPLHQSTPEKTGTRPKLRPPTEAQNQITGTKELYPPLWASRLVPSQNATTSQNLQ